MSACFFGQVAVDAPDRQVHLAEPPGRRVRLLPVDGDVADPPAVLLDELLALHEHAARAAARVIHPAFVGSQHLDQRADHAPRRVELAALLPLGTGELPQKVLVHPAQNILRPVLLVAQADGGDKVDQLPQPLFVEHGSGVDLRQDALQTRVVAFDGDHGVVDQLSDLRLLRTCLETRPAGFGRHPEHVLRPILVLVLGVGPLILLGQEPVVHLFEGVADVLQKDQPEHHVLVLGRIHIVPHLVRRQPQRRLEPQVRPVPVGLLRRFLLAHIVRVLQLTHKTPGRHPAPYPPCGVFIVMCSRGILKRLPNFAVGPGRLGWLCGFLGLSWQPVGKGNELRGRGNGRQQTFF